MKGRWGKRTLDVGFLGSIAGIVLIVCAVAAFLDLENAPGFFVLVTGMGVFVNGVLAYLRFQKKNYILGAVLAVLTVALLVLFVMQITMLEGTL